MPKDRPGSASAAPFVYDAPMASTREKLMAIYQAASERFGHQGWWPVDPAGGAEQRPLEVCIGAILTQNTAWANVEKALANLRSAGAMSLAALAAMEPAELAALVRPAGYFNVKSRRLKSFVARVVERWGGDLSSLLARPVDELRTELLAIKGVGRETADSIILYAVGKPSFVVDAYTCRILLRHFLIDEGADYEQVKELLEGALDADPELFNDFHAQFVAVGKHFCKPRPRCAGCPLEHLPHDACG
jgi:endonuclease-3 related protein